MGTFHTMSSLFFNYCLFLLKSCEMLMFLWEVYSFMLDAVCYMLLFDWMFPQCLQSLYVKFWWSALGLTVGVLFHVTDESSLCSGLRPCLTTRPHPGWDYPTMQRSSYSPHKVCFICYNSFCSQFCINLFH